MTGFAALDLETTGLSPDRDRIIEVSLVLYNQNGTEEHVYSTLVNPQCRIPSAASAVNGITDDMVAGAPTFTQIAHTLSDALEGRILVGHNITTFDNRFLEAEFADAGIHWTASGVLDTLRLARKAYPGLKTHKLSALCGLTGITNEHAHRAESDARATWQLLCTIAADDVDDLTGLDSYDLPVFASSAPVETVARKSEKVLADPTILQTCVGEVVVFTGGRPTGFATRDAAKDEVLRRGGEVGSSVTKKTTLVFVGDNAGAKLDRARELGVMVVPHAAFPTFLEKGREALGSSESVAILRFDGTADQVGVQSPPATPVQAPNTPPAPRPTSAARPATGSSHVAASAEAEAKPEPLAPSLTKHLPAPRISATPASVMAPPVTAPAVPRSSYRSIRLAVTLAILFGSLGVHRCYLGRWKSGLAMAAASLLSFGLLAPVMFIVGCVDAYRIAKYRFPA